MLAETIKVRKSNLLPLQNSMIYCNNPLLNLEICYQLYLLYECKYPTTELRLKFTYLWTIKYSISGVGGKSYGHVPCPPWFRYQVPSR